MNYKKIPLFIMLVAALVACIVTKINNYSFLDMLIVVFVTLVIFLIIGQIVVGVLKKSGVIVIEEEVPEEEAGEETINDEGEVVEKQSLETDDAMQQSV